MITVRMDKWLWAARFFKTRSMAARACELGRIESNGNQAKPAREVRVGDLLRIRNDSGDFQVEVLALSEMRGPAAVARTLYLETEASRELRMKVADERKATALSGDWREGKPSKRDRSLHGPVNSAELGPTVNRPRRRARFKPAICCKSRTTAATIRLRS